MLSTVVACLDVPRRLPAQPPAADTAASPRAPAARGTISGMVVEAESGTPVAGAHVVAYPDPPAALPPVGASPLVGASRATVTGDDGEYRLVGLPPGQYRLRVQRLGFRAVSLTVELRGAADSRVAVGLSVVPVRLQPVDVSSPLVEPYGRTTPAAHATARRVAVVRLRQRRHLSSDVQAFTRDDVEEAITFAESDLFRALHRLPGVATRDAYTAELRVRGAPGDQTRVLFDGLPLHNALHAFGGLSAVNTDALGAAVLHPGVAPASLGGGGAAVLDVRSRRGGVRAVPPSGDSAAARARAYRAVGELSMLSARGALDGEVLGGRGAWLVAGRRSHRIPVPAGDREDAVLPYAFHDVAVRLDLAAGGDRVVELSGLSTRDHVRGDLRDVLTGRAPDARAGGQRWGTRLVRATLDAPLAGGRVRHTVGESAFGFTGAASDAVRRPSGLLPGTPGLRSGITHGSVAGTWARATGAAAPDREAGWELARERATFTGVPPYAAPVTGPTAPTVAAVATRTHAALWGERRWVLGASGALSTGLRTEFGGRVLDAPPLRLAPRVTVRLDLGPDALVSASVGRSYQYAQPLAPAGLAPGALFVANHRWLLASATTPPVRSDLAVVGGERWLGGGWLAAAHLYARRSTGVALLDPTPGALTPERPLAVFGTTRAAGGELAVRRLLGRWTGSAAYTLGVVRARARGGDFPAPQDQRHAVDATAAVRLARWRLGAAATATSGTPYTRYVAGSVACRADGTCTGWDRLPVAGPAGAGRAPGYASVDLLAEWGGRVRRVDAAVYLQLYNVLDAPNPSTYVRSCASCGDGATGGASDDRLLPGIPRLPLLGARLAF
jgi:hypothetical protein